MRGLRAIATAWNRLWFAPASPYPIAAFRILLGGYLCVYFGALAPHVPVLFSNEGVYAPYFVPDYAPSVPIAWLLFGAVWTCCLLLMIGWRASLTLPCLLALFFHHYFLFLGAKHSSFDRLIVIFLLALWCGRCDSVWAVSADAEPKPASVFTARLVRFQIIMLYLGAGLWKAWNPAWRTGELLLSTMQGVWATPLAFFLVRQWPTMQAWQIASYLVFGGEVVLAFLLFFRRTRLLGITLGTLFHLGNTFILYIPEFLLCLAPYVFFIGEPAWDRLAAKLTPRSRAGA